MLNSSAPVKTFYDIDTPITVSQLTETGKTEYLEARQIAGLNLYFSFTGGPMLRKLSSDFGAKRAVPLYCSVDPDSYHSWPPHKRFRCDLGYMGTYAPDRQPKIEELLCQSARMLPDSRFIVAGPQYPRSVRWPANVRRVRHLNPRWHARFYSSSRLTLNVTRRAMVQAGYSPSVRLFEAAACGAVIVSDWTPFSRLARKYFSRYARKTLLLTLPIVQTTNCVASGFSRNSVCLRSTLRSDAPSSLRNMCDRLKAAPKSHLIRPGKTMLHAWNLPVESQFSVSSAVSGTYFSVK